LTKFELRVYGCLCYGSIALFFMCGYLLFRYSAIGLEKYFLVISFVFLTVGAIFGFAIKHDVRRFNKK